MFSDELLKKASRAATEIARLIDRGERVSDRGYQREVLKEILLHISLELSKFVPEKLHGPKRVLVFLPENVPIIPFQLLPIIVSYDLDIVFKAPASENLFYKILGEKTGLKFIWLSHCDAIEMAEKFDFILGFGGEELGEALKTVGKPYRFFGPRFSIGISENLHELSLLFEDALSFDGEACLAPIFIFTENFDFEVLWHELKNAAKFRPSQETFNKYVFEYATSFLVYYSENWRISENIALFQVKEFPKFVPQRTVFIINKTDEKEILNFLRDKKDIIQAIITTKEVPLLMEKTSASITLPPGKSQLPPLTWFFQKGLNLHNFFEL